MKSLFPLIALFTFLTSGFSQTGSQASNDQNKILYGQSRAFTLTNDIALVRPLINTNDSNGGYYSEYYISAFNYMYCGAVVKNTGSGIATHVYLEMKILDMDSNVIETYHSDTVAMLTAGEETTVNISGELTFQPWFPNNYDLHQFLFIVKSDSLDENPANNFMTAPFTIFSDWFWTLASRSIYMTNSYDIGQSANFQPGDFLGFTLSIPDGLHWMGYLCIYLPEPWPDSLVMTAMVYRNGQLIATSPVYLYNPPQAIWVCSDPVLDFMYTDSSYIFGVEIDYLPGTSFKIGADTSTFHNFAAETKARIGGNWTTLNFVPVMQLICDPEGIPETEITNEARVFPNPTSGTLFIDNIVNSKVELYDLSGKMLMIDDKMTFSRKIDISFLPKGIYFLRIISKERINTLKIAVY